MTHKRRPTGHDADRPTNGRRVLLLVPPSWEPEATEHADVMFWADAQSAGQLKFSNHDKFVCFPPVYASTNQEPDRDGMFRLLRRRLEQGASLVFLYPPRVGTSNVGADLVPSKEAGVETSDEWRQAMHLIRSVVGTVLSPLEGAKLLDHHVAASCPIGISNWLDRGPSDSVFDVTPGCAPTPVSHDETVVLAGFEAMGELPSTLAGFAASGGAWLAIPIGDRRTLDGPEWVACLALTDELEPLRSPDPAADAPGATRAPEGATWDQLRIVLTDHHTIRVTLRGPAPKTWSASYGDLGMEDARNKKPNSQWELLVALAHGEGILACKDHPSHRVRRLRKCLQEYFGAPGNPLQPRLGDRAWVARFSIRG